jgi:hypothetical protein
MLHVNNLWFDDFWQAFRTNQLKSKKNASLLRTKDPKKETKTILIQSKRVIAKTPAC